MNEQKIEELVSAVDRARLAGDLARVAELDQEIREVKGGEHREITGTGNIVIPFPGMKAGAVTEDFDEWDTFYRDGEGCDAKEGRRMELTTVKVAIEELRYKWQRDGEEKETVDVPLLLVASVAKRGIVNPLIVTRAEDGEIYVWIGNQRLIIAKQLGVEELDCVFVSSAVEVAEALSNYEEC